MCGERRSDRDVALRLWEVASMKRWMWASGLGFGQDTNGAVAPLFALSFVPFLMFGGMAIDYGRALSVRTHLQSTADAAVLAAARIASNANEDGSTDKEKLVSNYIAANFKRTKAVKSMGFTVHERDSKLILEIKAKVATTLGSLVTPYVDVDVRAVSRTASTQAPLCAVSLNPSVGDAFKLWGTADLVAPSCAMVSNSTSPSAMVSGGSASATGGLFCSAGGTSGGGFSPPVQTGCPAVSDPYDGKYTAAAIRAATGMNVAAFCNHNGKLTVRNAQQINAQPNRPYVFCGGLDVVSGGKLTLGPGLYVIFSELLIGSNSSLIATNGTTIFLADSSLMGGTKQGLFTVQAGGTLQLTAPSAGYFNGMAILQPVVTGYTAAMARPVVNTIIGGGIVDIVGVVYAPQGTVKVTGNGVINPNSQFFSLVADRIDIEGNGVLQINNKSDYNFYGMTPLAATGGNGAVSLAE